jgi:hypothetical protein
MELKKMKNKLWIIATFAGLGACFCGPLTAPRYTEADIEQAWSDGYTQYQIDRYIPKPDHKAPLHGLKGKVNG